MNFLVLLDTLEFFQLDFWFGLIISMIPLWEFQCNVIPFHIQEWNDDYVDCPEVLSSAAIII